MAITPKKLSKGSHIRIISPSRTAAVFYEGMEEKAEKRLKDIGLTVSWGKNAKMAPDKFKTTPAESRVADLHEAFADPSVDMVLASMGGYKANEMLPFIDWNLIRNNPKIFCSMSDGTVLSNAIFHKAGLVTYYGVTFSHFAQLDDTYTFEYFQKALLEDKPFQVEASKQWWEPFTEGKYDNAGCEVIQPGKAKGEVVGGHITTFSLLMGTDYMPELANRILFLEENSNYSNNKDLVNLDQNIAHLMMIPGFEEVQAIVFGRFEPGSNVSVNDLKEIVSSKKGLKDKLIVCNADFGHTAPTCTFPIGGSVEIQAEADKCTIRIL